MMILPRHALASLLLSALVALSGCHKKEHGQCAEPHEDVTWFWMKDSGPTGTAYKCVLCDNNAPSHSDQTSCFYVYPESGWEDPALCQANVCSDNPASNDPVKQSHGVWKHLGPILKEPLAPGSSTGSEESILLPPAPADEVQPGGNALGSDDGPVSSD